MDKILPIGSVVRLKGMTDGMSMMIAGYYPLEESIEKIFEYSGILYPQGFIGDRSIFLFDSEDVEEIIFEGYSDREGEEYRGILPKVLEKIAEDSK